MSIFLIIAVACLLSLVSHAAEQDLTDVEIEPNVKTVEVELDNTPIISEQPIFRNVNWTYRERRPDWTNNINVTYNSYIPENYQPDFVTQNFSNYYGSPEVPLIELGYELKRNTSLVSISALLSAGYYKNNIASDAASSFNLTFGFAGLRLTFDNLMSEPIFAPYATIGTYLAMYEEKQGTSSSIKGNTAPAMYYSVGSKFQLNWMDKDSAQEAYRTNGIENTFLFVEGKSLMSSGDRLVNLSSSLQLSGGLSVEY